MTKYFNKTEVTFHNDFGDIQTTEIETEYFGSSNMICMKMNGIVMSYADTEEAKTILEELKKVLIFTGTIGEE